MEIEITRKDEQRLSGFYFYIQDVSHEIRISIQNLINNKDKTPNTLPQNEALVFYASLRIALNTIAIGICKVSEAIEAKDISRLLNSLSIESAENLKNFKKKYYLEDIKEYRNTYAVHPLNKDKEFPSCLELTRTLEKALKLKMLNNSNTSIDCILDSLEYIHGKKNGNGLLCIISKLGRELQKKINLVRP